MLKPYTIVFSSGTSSLSNKSSASVTIEDNVQMEERTFIEDMELETKALTEPLPTNQQVSCFLLVILVNVLIRFHVIYLFGILFLFPGIQKSSFVCS